MQHADTLDRPSDSYAILGNVLDTVRSWMNWAELHRSSEPSRHFHRGHDDSAIDIMTAVAELALAAQQADGLRETISRAYGGNAVVQWFNEMEPPEAAQ